MKNLLSARIAFLMVSFVAPGHAGVILQLLPGPDIGGARGSVTGWGFSLSNDANYLVVTSSDFFTAVPIGTYADWISLAFEVVGPGAVWTRNFSSASTSGLGAVAIDPFAVLGSVSTGYILLTYDLYSRSPLDPLFSINDVVSLGNVIQATASVTVVPVPEPSSAILILIALMAAMGTERVARP